MVAITCRLTPFCCNNILRCWQAISDRQNKMGKMRILVTLGWLAHVPESDRLYVFLPTCSQDAARSRARDRLMKTIAIDLDDTLNNFTETLQRMQFVRDETYALSEE